MPIFELTSSGLSHTMSDYLPTASRIVNEITSSFYTASETNFDLNFGNIIIDNYGGVRMEIRNN